jgi:glucose 1-dehydrogenase
MSQSPSPTSPVALVTGAGAGLGASIARLFARDGARVVVSDIDEARGQSVVAELEELGSEAVFVRADVRDDDQVAALVTATVEHFGRLDHAVNNAAVPPDSKPLLELDVAALDRVLDVNLRAVAICMTHQARQMVAQGQGRGTIVNVGSTSSVRPQPSCPAYVAAKHGVVGLTKAGAIELAEHGVRVNAVLPGGMDTPMIREARAALGRVEDRSESRLSLFGRLADPAEVAEAVVWLSSDKASYVTGAMLAVDSGYLAR